MHRNNKSHNEEPVSFVSEIVNDNQLYEHFYRNGFLMLRDVLTLDELDRYVKLFDNDRAAFGPPNWWHPFQYQTRNCNALVTSPEFDDLLRHVKIMRVIEFLMDGPVCFSEICLRHMAPYNGPARQKFHRDRPHWQEHPLRMDYVQLMLYLTDVDKDTHCFSMSPESVGDPILETEAQLERNGIVDFHGPAGTVVLFNISALHTATVRVTAEERKTVQAYYGHRSRPVLSNCSVMPPRLWRHDPDPEVRAFYGNLNETSKVFLSACDPVGR